MGFVAACSGVCCDRRKCSGSRSPSANAFRRPSFEDRWADGLDGLNELDRLNRLNGLKGLNELGELSELNEFNANDQTASHPDVRQHPRSGRRICRLLAEPVDELPPGGPGWGWS